MSCDGINYEDNYKGDALAAMIRPEAFEIRFHQDFSDEIVCRVIEQIAGESGFEPLRSMLVTYQGREIWS